MMIDEIPVPGHRVEECAPHYPNVGNPGKGNFTRRSRRTPTPDEVLVERVMNRLLFDLAYVEGCSEQTIPLTEDQRRHLTMLLDDR